MKLRGDHVVSRQERCVLRSLELLPASGLVNHVAGIFYEYVKHDYEKATFHLKKAVEKNVYGAYMNLIDLKYV